jgi:hypothetical protein
MPYKPAKLPTEAPPVIRLEHLCQRDGTVGKPPSVISRKNRVFSAALAAIRGIKQRAILAQDLLRKGWFECNGTGIGGQWVH